MTIIKTIPGDINFQLFEQASALLYSPGSIRLQQKDNLNNELLNQCYVVKHNGKIKAKAALYNNPYLRYNDKKAACIGNYECVDDVIIANELLSVIQADAKLLGAEYLIGPMNGSTWDDYRFCIDHNYPIFFTEPQHHLYYNDHFIKFGFHEIGRYISGISDCTNYQTKYADVIDSLYKKGLRIRIINLEDFESELQKLYDFCSISFQNNFLYTPVGFTLFKEKYIQAKKIIDPEFFRIAEDSNGNIVGFMFCLKDLYNTSENNLIIKTIARLPGEKWKGLTTVTGDIIYSLARDKGYQHVLHAFMHQSNASVGVSKKFSGTVIRNYSLYGKEIQ